MFIPDVINTLLMGLIFMVVIVTIVRPFVLNMVGEAMSNNDMQKAAIAEVEREMMRKAELFESQRADRIKYQMLLLEKPPKLTPKPVQEAEPEVVPEPVVQAAPEVVVEEVPVEAVEATTENITDQAMPEEAVAEEPAEDAEPEETLAEGEIEIREGESLAEIKERIRKEQQKTKKPTIPPELLNSANSYEDKVGIVRMVVQSDQARVASAIRGMIQVK